MSTTLRRLSLTAVWLLVGGLVAWAMHMLETRRERVHFVAQGDVVQIHRGPDGHYHWPGKINGRAVDFLVDTGATGTAISSALARELGLKSLGDVQSHTAGGIAHGELVRANIELQGGVKAERLRVVALPALDERPLLGMDVLGRLHWQQRDGVLSINLRSTP